MQALPSVQPLLASQSGFLNRLVRNPGTMRTVAGAGAGQARAGIHYSSAERGDARDLGQGFFLPQVQLEAGHSFGLGNGKPCMVTM